MKKYQIIFLSLLCLIIVGCGKKEKLVTENRNNEELQDDITINQYPDKEIDGLLFTNASIVYEEGASTVLTKVTNNNDYDFELVEFSLIARDLVGNEIARFPGYVGEVIPAGETVSINSSIDIDLSSAYTLDYIIYR